MEESVARYLAQLDTADRQEPYEELAAKTAHLRDKLVRRPQGAMQPRAKKSPGRAAPGLGSRPEAG